MKTVIIKESQMKYIIEKLLKEQSTDEPKLVNPHLKDEKIKKDIKDTPRCVAGNVMPLEVIVGPSDNFKTYGMNLNKRDGGINGMTDTLDMLRTIRLHPNIKDGGEHLSFNLMNHLNKFRNKNYFDETNNQCIKAMDKVIELYKENEHGEELVKDIEKVLNHKDPTPRAKEYLKRCLTLIKEK
jgi:hypothetical protein